MAGMTWRDGSGLVAEGHLRRGLKHSVHISATAEKSVTDRTHLFTTETTEQLKEAP